ncbi:MAG: hypothetical protein JWO09_2801 [Bacteroidetes bacterium]|nr:hypothetical protein [Bacteroidota bacterium]
MAILTRAILKSFFQSGDRPSAPQFSSLIDSMINYPDDRDLLGLQTYDPTRVYITGETTVYNSSIYQAIRQTTDTFNPDDWSKIAGYVPGAVTYRGTWKANTNTPNLITSPKVGGDYYVVSAAGNTNLDGVTDWNIGDWAIYNGVKWEKVDNTDNVTDAKNINGPGEGIFKNKNDTVLRFKKITNTDGSVKLTSAPDSLDLAVEFDDANVSASRTWSSFKIDAALSGKEAANPNIQAHISNLNNPHQTTKTQVGLGNVENIKVNYAAAADPSVTDDSAAGYAVGSSWINTSNGKGYVCVDASVAAAIWAELTPNPNVAAHIANMNNPHNTTKEQVGLGNVLNTLVNFSGIVDPTASNDNTEGYGIGSTWLNVSGPRQFTCFDASTGAAVWQEITPKPNIQEHIENLNNPHQVTKAQVGLSEADNTSDLNKPVSTAQEAADTAVYNAASAYADSLVIGLLNDRGNYDASSNTFPVDGGSGASGAVKKGDLWTVNVAGILGGQDAEPGDLIRALVNNPGQTSTNWAITQSNIGYVAENAANKAAAIIGNYDDVHYPTVKLVVDELATKEPVITPSGNATDYWNGTKTFVDFGDSARTVFLSGLNLLTNQVISATDNVIQAFGYLQRQISDNLSVLSSHVTDSSNPHNVTKAQVGLGAADNTSDINKPVSTAQAAADAVVLDTAKSYADSLVVGLLDDRGNYDASSNTFPSTGGSGASGAVNKGDIWTVSVAGTLGSQNVEPGDLVRALVNNPGQTASNWAITQNNIGYVAENSANKASSLVGTYDDIHYPSVKLVVDQLATKEPSITASGNASDFWSGAKTFRNLANDVREVTLSGLSLVSGQVISATDSIVQALGYLQKQVSTNLAALSAHVTNTSNPHSVTKAQVGLGNVQDIKVNLSATADPAGTNDNTQGYAIGSTWVNTVNAKQFVALSVATGAAVWKELTNSVFGTDYVFLESTTAASTTSGSFQPYPASLNSMVLSTGTRSGTYRIQWSALISNGKKRGQFQLKNITSANPQVSAVIDMQSTDPSEMIAVGWTGNIVLTGTSQDFVIQFRSVASGDTQTIQRATIELQRVS